MSKNPKNPIYSELKDDLLSLYCNIKHSGIEKILMKVAYEVEMDFIKWLKSNDRILRTKVDNTTIIDFLTLLSELKRGSPLNRGDLVKYVLGSPERSSAIKYLWSFDSILKSGEMNEMLSQFSKNINDLTNVFSKGEQGEKSENEDREIVAQDLKKIYDMYVDSIHGKKIDTKKPSPASLKREMAKNLLYRFSNEIANAFESSDMKDVAKEIRNGALAKSYKYTEKVVPFKMPTLGQINIINDLVNYVASHYEIGRENYNHDHVELKLMNEAGIISNTEMAEIYNKFEESKNPIDDIEDRNEGETFDLKDKIKSDFHMNPAYIGMLCIFFHYLQKKLKII